MTRGSRAALAALAGFVLLALGGVLLDPPGPSPGALALLATGLSMTLASLVLAPPRALAATSSTAAGDLRPRFASLAVAVFAALLAWRASRPRRLHARERLALGGGGRGVVLRLVAHDGFATPATESVDGDRRGRDGLGPAGRRRRGGRVLQLYRLSEVPGEPTSGHAEKLLDIYDVRASLHPIFFPRNTRAGARRAVLHVTNWLIDVLGLPPTFETHAQARNGAGRHRRDPARVPARARARRQPCGPARGADVLVLALARRHHADGGSGTATARSPPRRRCGSASATCGRATGATRCSWDSLSAPVCTGIHRVQDRAGRRRRPARSDRCGGVAAGAADARGGRHVRRRRHGGDRVAAAPARTPSSTPTSSGDESGRG